MPILPRRFNWGNKLINENPDLYRQLSASYEDISGVVNTKVSKYAIDGTDAPASNQINKNFDIGDIWVRTDTDTAWIMTNRTTAEAVTWTQIT